MIKDMHPAQRSVYPEILEWSSHRPEWQRDALRRLLINRGNLTEVDVNEPMVLCKQASDPSNAQASPIKSQPLTSDHLPISLPSNEHVQLISLSNIQGVNALMPSASLDFSPEGLTVIYGDNGTGKSGFARILKDACWARERADEILPNIYLDPPPASQSAIIAFQVSDKPLDSFIWRPGKEQRQKHLSAISVFDSGCASIYVSKENHIVYVPLGIDLLHVLVKACDTIKNRLQEEAIALSNVQLPQIPNEILGTEEARWLGEISASTTKYELMKYCTVSDQERKEITRIAAVIQEKNPDSHIRKWQD
jgi:hypothetical protein